MSYPIGLSDESLKEIAQYYGVDARDLAEGMKALIKDLQSADGSTNGADVPMYASQDRTPPPSGYQEDQLSEKSWHGWMNEFLEGEPR